jgi:hypothetical protein
MDAEGAKKLMTESGNGLQCRVAQFFRVRGWTVLMSPYYIDASTDRPRELDLIVERSYPVQRIWAGNVPKSVRVRLFIECKYIVQGAVFWFDAMDRNKTVAWIESNTPFRRDNIYIRPQHYLAQGDQVAKLFASETKKAEENDPIFRGINQCLNGYIYNQDRASLIDLLDGEEAVPLRYPVVVCSSFGDFFRTSVQNGGDPIPIAENFLLEMDYAYIHPRSKQMAREFFLVDFVDFERITTFLASIEAEVGGATAMVGDN